MHWPANKEDATTKCIGGQVFGITSAEKVRQLKLDADSHSFARAVTVIERVIVWLNHDGSSVFKDNKHTAAPAVEAATTYAPGTTVAPSHVHSADDNSGLTTHYTAPGMVSLLEGAAKSSTNAEAKHALSKAAQLLEGSTSVGRAAADVIRLLEQILGDMQSSKAKIDQYKTTSQDEANSQIDNLVKQIKNLKTERETGMLHKARLTDSMAGYTVDVGTKASEIASEKASWALKYDQRELNSQKCIDFMSYFDAETQTNTEELLILKKTIDIIKHITCEATSAPTAFPTTFPTTSPTVLTNSPTAYPTRSPTAAPTGAPTANPTNGNACGMGDYKFMAKVFKNPERFAVPAYADGVKYNIAAGMIAGECKTLETSHTNVEGAVQTIKHQYRCCGSTGSLYGAVSQSGNSAAKDLCVDGENGDHCGLFGANMFLDGSTDPSGTITTAQTTRPTTAPTAFPTRAPSTAPTANPTKAPTSIPTAFPTGAPTDYPTALDHASSSLQGSSAYGKGIYNITERANSTEVSDMTGPTALLPIATTIVNTLLPVKKAIAIVDSLLPKKAPPSSDAATTFPTAAPTAAPIAVVPPGTYSEGAIVHTNKPYSLGWDYSASFSSDSNGWLTVDPTTGAMTQGQYGAWGFTTAAIEAMVGGSINSEWSLKIPFEWDSLGDNYIGISINCPTTNWGPDHAGQEGTGFRSFVVQTWPTGSPNFQNHEAKAGTWQHVATGKPTSSRENMRADFFATLSPRNLLLTRTADKGFKIDIVDSAGTSMFGAGGVELTSSHAGFDIGKNRLPFCIYNNAAVSTYSTPVVV
jgi:hypothetical protein